MILKTIPTISQQFFHSIGIARKELWHSLRDSFSSPSQKLLRAMTNSGLQEAGSTNTGITVTEKTALTRPAYFAAIKILAESVGMLPWELYRTTKEGKEKAKDHPLYEIIHLRPNPLMTSSSFRETIVGHQASWGNSYVRIKREEGKIVGLYPLLPDRTRLKIEGDKYYFETHDNNNKPIHYNPSDIVHNIGLSFDGLNGYTLFRYFKEVIGGAKAVEDYGNIFFKNGSHIGGIVKHPNRINREDGSYERVKKSLQQKYQGLGKSHELMLLDDGMEYQKIGISPGDAEAIKTKEYSLLDFARILRIPPHMMGYLKDATFSNVEHMGIEFIKFTLVPILNRMAQEYTYKLLDKEERKEYFIAFNLNALMLGDIKARSEFYHQMTIDGIFNADMVLGLEDMNYQPNGLGKKFYIPLNMVEKGEPTEEPGTERKREKEYRAIVSSRSIASRRRIGKAYQPKLKKAIQKLIDEESEAVREKAKELLNGRQDANFREWLDEYYESFHQKIKKGITPVISSLSGEIKTIALEEVGTEENIDIQFEKFRNKYINNYAYQHSSKSRASLKGKLNDVQKKKEEGLDINELEEIEAMLDSWQDKRAGIVSSDETTNARSAFAKSVYASTGIRKIRSVASGKSCPYCEALDGVVIGIEGFFLKKGDEFQPDGAEEALPINSNISHPAYHGGCDCDIAIE